MIDRETVIKELENYEPYARVFSNITITGSVVLDALALLKEQEPKQVVGIADSIEGMEVGYCPSCDRAIVNKKIDETKFCKFCGQRVSWKGSEME